MQWEQKKEKGHPPEHWLNDDLKKGYKQDGEA